MAATRRKPRKPMVVQGPSARNLRHNVIDEDRAARAWRAVQKFRRMNPNLTAFARALTRDPECKVILHFDRPKTDGKLIYTCPPIELGDEHKHSRDLCNKRDVDGVMSCPACAIEEDVFITVYHEIAHLIFGSFDEMSDADRRDVVVRAIEEAAADDDANRASMIAKRINDRLNSLPKGMQTYVAAANAVSPFLLPILNAFEDARVNRAMYHSRPGTQVMFKAHAAKNLHTGVTDPDGNVLHSWKDEPVNSQAIVGLFAKAAGYEYHGHLDEDVVEMLDDPEVTKLVAQMSTARSAKAVYRMGFPVLEAIRKHGFCYATDDPEPLQQPQRQPVASPPQMNGQNKDNEPESSAPQDGKQDDATEPNVGNDGDNADGQQGDDPENEPAGDEGEQEAADGGHGEAGEDDGSDDAQGQQGATQAYDDVQGQDDDEDDEGAEQGPEGEPADDEGDHQEGDDDEGDHQEGDDDQQQDQEGDEDEGHQGDDDDQGDDGGGGSENGDADGDVAGDQGAPQLGTPEDAQRALEMFGGHVAPTPEQERDERLNTVELERAVAQEEWFDAPSRMVLGVNLNRYDTRDAYAEQTGWRRLTSDLVHYRGQFGLDIPDRADERVMAPALMAMRTAFADNRRSRQVRDLKVGRVNNKVLARRAPAAIGDPRLFQKKRTPGRRDYFVVVGLDLSSSTVGRNIALIKSAALAQADLLDRLGVDFAVYAHSGGASSFGGTMVDMFVVKEPHERWAQATRQRLLELTPFGINLDGHTFEFYRKVMDRQQQTDKVLLYYTDGEMPCSNYEEELSILRRELSNCEQRGYSVFGVGINSDSPINHGLDTVLVKSMDDIPKVVEFIKDRLS